VSDYQLNSEPFLGHPDRQELQQFLLYHSLEELTRQTSLSGQDGYELGQFCFIYIASIHVKAPGFLCWFPAGVSLFFLVP
jgi:hypothetical protein